MKMDREKRENTKENRHSPRKRLKSFKNAISVIVKNKIKKVEDFTQSVTKLDDTTDDKHFTSFDSE